MAQPAPSHRPIDVDAYLEAELSSELRHEYVAGEGYAMCGASDAFNLIAGNLFSALHRHLRGGPPQAKRESKC
jgi:Uma2 family endonuclease